MKAKPIIAAVTLAALPCVAAQPAPPINIMFAADNASCTAWSNSASNKLVRAHYESWARGFVSGHNYANPAHQIKVGDFPSGDELDQYFDKYCRENPQQTFVAGAIQLVAQLRDAAAAKPPAGKPAPARKGAPAK